MGRHQGGKGGTPVLQYSTVLHVLRLYSTVLRLYSACTPLYSTCTPLVLHSYSAVIRCTLLYSAILRCTPLYSAVLHSYSTVLRLYSTRTPEYWSLAFSALGLPLVVSRSKLNRNNWTSQKSTHCPSEDEYTYLAKRQK